MGLKTKSIYDDRNNTITILKEDINREQPHTNTNLERMYQSSRDKSKLTIDKNVSNQSLLKNKHISRNDNNKDLEQVKTIITGEPD